MEYPRIPVACQMVAGVDSLNVGSLVGLGSISLNDHTQDNIGLLDF